MMIGRLLLIITVFLISSCASGQSSTGPSPVPTAVTVPGAAPVKSPVNATPGVPGDPVAGSKVFASQPCSSCHDISSPFPGGAICPNLGNIAAEAARIVKSTDYHGNAHDPAGYIRESIVNPNAYIVPGAAYHTSDGQSAMPKNFGTALAPQQIDDLVAFLMLQNNGKLP